MRRDPFVTLRENPFVELQDELDYIALQKVEDALYLELGERAWFPLVYDFER